MNKVTMSNKLHNPCLQQSAVYSLKYIVRCPLLTDRSLLSAVFRRLFTVALAVGSRLNVFHNLRFAIFDLHFALLFFCVSLYLGVNPLFAQVVRLPAVIPEEEKNQVQLVSHPDSMAETVQSPGGTAADVPTQPASDARPGMFQKIIFNGTWLAGGNDSRSFGQNDLESKIILALPCPTRDSPLVITPGFTVHYLQGPASVDLPPRLYETYMQFRWLSQVTPLWGVDLAVTPGVYSDFNQESSDALRVTGHGAIAWTYTPTMKFVLGAAYLDMPYNNVIPIGGLIWTPNEDVKFDILYPNPKISKRIRSFDGCNKDAETWAYIEGEFGNDAWAMAHSDGSTDQVSLSDARLILGLERKIRGGLCASLEIGYVFSRRIRFNSDIPDFYPEDTVLLRGGLMY
jgi:hypothetical protein